MSAAVETYRDDVEATYAVDFSRDREPMKARKRFPEYRRKGGAPTRVSGMHCRRSKRWTWGSGRGARVLNMRAFAGAVAFAVASIASSVMGVTIDMKTIGDPNNLGAAASAGAPGGPYGSVGYVYELATFETTNAQYVDFLNAVGASNPNGIYDPRMDSDPTGGIVQSGSPGSYTYSLKPANGVGSGNGNTPVNFVSWFSAARFANWLHNGQSGDPNLIEIGSYSLNGQTSGALPSRSPLATYVLPTLNEWIKGGFHTGGLAPTDYTNSLSHYGLYEMMGNVAEMTETTGSNPNRWTAMSGSFGTANASLASFNLTLGFAPTYVGGGARTAQIGFRLAKVEPVPEPGTIALAGVGIAGLAGLEWKRRRKVKAARLAA
jgi:formylglycine-generating enzyme required for sulfatase activity